MSDPPWGVDDDSPLDEGSETTAVPAGSAGEQRAGEATDADPDRDPGDVKLPWGADEEAHPGPATPGGQPNLEPAPPVAGRPTRGPGGTTNDASPEGANG